MNHEVSEKIRAILSEGYLSFLKAKEFKTRGNDLQFRIPSKNALKTNMIKIQEIDNGWYMIKYFTYQPFKHVFNLIDCTELIPGDKLLDRLEFDLGIEPK